MNEIITLSAKETADHLKAKRLSVSEVVEAHLNRLGEVNPTINAVAEVVEGARALAHQMDAAHPGDTAPPLWGVPVTVKINVDQSGYANTNGLDLFKENIASEDSPVVANLKAAGAVIIGRTNTPEFSLRWFTSNSLHGKTLNPWKSDLTPGGSSGGAAAAVAAGIGAIGHGNDLGGSLRYPAFCCGVASIRPSMGRVPVFNPTALAERPPMASAMAVQGPIARTVADLKISLQAMSARSSFDPMWMAAPNSDRVRSAGLLIGYCPQIFENAEVDSAVNQAMSDALAGLRSAGFECVETPFPSADRAAELWGELLFAETDLLMRDAIDANGSAEFQRMYQGYLNAYRSLDFREYLLAAGERVFIQRETSKLFDKIDAFLMPTSLERPFANDLDFERPEQVENIVAAQRPLHVVNLLGLPAVAIPTGLVDGSPVGVQLVGPMHDDDFVLDVAERLEAELTPIGMPQLNL